MLPPKNLPQKGGVKGVWLKWRPRAGLRPGMFGGLRGAGPVRGLVLAQEKTL